MTDNVVFFFLMVAAITLPFLWGIVMGYRVGYSKGKLDGYLESIRQRRG